MMRHLALPALALTTTLATGCIVIDDNDDWNDPCCDGPPVVVNHAPEVWDGEAGCYYDGYNRDDIVYFEAVVDDPDGLGDVVEVWADVYDTYDGTLVESFELYATTERGVYFSDWLGHTTWIDCAYPGYEVDLVAYDSYDDYGVLTVIPWTY
jgi:hypothetical protein